jgi:hypothetical protein
VKAAAKIPFKSFVDEYVSPEIDSLEIYAPLSLIRKFSESEITSQQLIDGSVVLVNSNRIQLSLSQS